MRKVVVPIVVALVVVCGVGGVVLKNKAASMAVKPPSEGTTATVKRGTLDVMVVETGLVDAVQVVEVKGRVTGRLAKLFVDEGDIVKKGQLIAIIDPQETKLKVEQDAAQLRGAESAVQRSDIEIQQRRISAKAAYDQTVARLHQLELETTAQPTLTQAAIRTAETNLASAREERNRLVKSAHPTQRTNAESAVREAEANYENAQADYQRQSELANKGFVSGRTSDAAKLQIDLARVRLATAKETLLKLDAQLRSELAKQDEVIAQAEAALLQAKANSFQPAYKRQEVASARAAVDQARAALMDADVLAKTREQSRASVAQLRSVLTDSQRQLRETEIRSPIDGVVIKKGLNVGELATGLSSFSSGSTIVKLEDRTTMRVKLDMNEIDVAKLRVGMKATITVDALPEDKFTGVVRKIAPASKDASTTGQAATTSSSSDAVVRYQVEIQIDRASADLRSGMTAKCSLNTLHHENVLILPLEFIGREGEKTFATFPAAKPEGVGEQRDIKIGASSGSMVEIVSGLKENEVVARPKFNGPKRKGVMQMGGGDE